MDPSSGCPTLPGEEPTRKEGEGRREARTSAACSRPRCALSGGVEGDPVHVTPTRPGTTSKCSSRLARVRSCCLASAAIQRSFSGIGVPFARSVPSASRRAPQSRRRSSAPHSRRQAAQTLDILLRPRGLASSIEQLVENSRREEDRLGRAAPDRGRPAHPRGERSRCWCRGGLYQSAASTRSQSASPRGVKRRRRLSGQHLTPTAAPRSPLQAAATARTGSRPSAHRSRSPRSAGAARTRSQPPPHPSRAR